jgi:hypothetical protein
MLPDTTTIEQRDNIVYWENTDFQISIDEATAIRDRVIELLDRPGVDGVLVDNEDSSGTWPNEVDEVWSDLMGEIYQRGSNCATVSPNATNAIHINRLSRDNDTDDKIKAFRPDEREEAFEFVGAQSQRV